MKEELKELWLRKYEKQGRIDITVFFVNIFMFLCHTFFTILYIVIGHKLMIYYSLITSLIYILYIGKLI